MKTVEPVWPNSWKHDFGTNWILRNSNFWQTGCIKMHFSHAGIIEKFILVTPKTLKMIYTRSTSEKLSTSCHHERLKIDFGPTESMKTVNRSSRIAENIILGQSGSPEYQLLTNRMHKNALQSCRDDEKFILVTPNVLKMSYTRPTSINDLLHTITSD